MVASALLAEARPSAVRETDTLALTVTLVRGRWLVSDVDCAEEGFRVIDRRGQPAEPSAPREAGPRTEPNERGWRAASSEAEVPKAARPPELASLFLMFASSVLVHLGEADDPVTGEARKDLDQAQYAIDLLMLLRDKTEGNRTPEETRLITEILRDLQMRFVRAVEQP